MTTRAVFPTFTELLEFAQASSDNEFLTLAQRKPFRVFVQADEFYFRPHGQAERRAQTSRVKEFLTNVQETDSWKAGEYADDSFNASYLLALINAWQSGGTVDGSGVAWAPASQTLSEVQRETLKSGVRAAIRHRDCAIRDNVLVHGFQVHNRRALKNQWIGSVYWGENNLGNDVEIAFDPVRFAHPGEAGKLNFWFETTARQLQHSDARNHSGDNESWFRAGFTFGSALDFFSRLAAQTDPLTPVHDRWLVEFSTAPQSPTTASVEPSAPVKREEASVDRMLAMAKQACEQSGQVRSTAAKVKTFLFADDDDFRNHVSELLASQANRCAITHVPLQFAGDCDDEECLASLDRIDSDGHYAPGNLQIVCRFVNRWKSDDADENFRRLLQLVRT